MISKNVFEYYVANIECRTIPREVYWLEDYSFAIFPSATESNWENIIHNKNDQFKSPSLGLLIYQPKGKLTLNFVKNILDDFLTCFCLIYPDYFLFSSIKDFLEMDKKSFETNIRTTVNLQSVINRSIYKKSDLETKYGGLLLDYKKIVCGLSINLQFNFFPIFKKFVSLHKNCKDYQAIKLWVFASFMHPVIGKFYDNVNMRYSLLFTLMESFLPKKKKRIKYQCKNCGVQKTKNVEMSVSARFAWYINNLPISEELKERAIKTFECMRPVRNKFYHNAESESEFANKKDLRMISGKNTLTYKEDLELNDGREFGPKFMQDFIRTILLNRLILGVNNNYNMEFNSSQLWDHFKPLTVIGKVDISFSSLVGYLHVGILDFKELEKRIQLCKSDKICETRKIRQFYFENENSQNSIMIVCDTPSNFSSSFEKKNRESFISKNKPLQNILRSLNIEDAYITNLVKCGSIYRLKKSDISIRNCWQFMLREIEFCQS